MRNKIM